MQSLSINIVPKRNLGPSVLRGLIIILLLIFCSTQGKSQLFSDCFTAEIICDLNDFPNGDRFDLPASGTSLECRGTEFLNPLFMPFVAGPGDVTFSALAFNCTPGAGNTGLIMGVWELCPGFFPSDCIALTDCFFYPFGLGNIPRELIVDDALLEDGRIYYFVIAGCEGAVCSFTMEVDGNSLEVPELDDSEVDYQTFECSEGNLPPYTYCQGATVNFIAENNIFNSLGGEWYWSIEEISSDADADQVEWFGNARRGVGNPVFNGSFLFRLYGDNQMNFTFNRPGTYNICVDEFRTTCETREGPLCQEVTIIAPPPVQEIGYFNLCYRNVEFQGWDGPDFPNALGEQWEGGNIELADILSSPQDRDDYYAVERFIPTNDCGCSYTQYVYINLVGDEPPGEAELFLTECQLPYDWFDITFFSLDDFQGQELVLAGGANEADYNGMKCDSFVIINVTEIEIPDTIVFSGCANMEYLYTFMIDEIEVEIDNDEEEIGFTGLRYQWIDSTTGISLTPLTDNPTTALADGTYYVSVTGFIDDVNHNDNSVNTSPNSFVNCLFGPYQVDNPELPIPRLQPYNNVLCSYETLMQQYEILNPDPLYSYNWILPNNLISQANYNVDSTTITINDISNIGTQNIGVYSTSDCGISDTLYFSINILDPILSNNLPNIEACINTPVRINYNSNNGDQYNWTIPGATISGNTNDGFPFDISYANTGLYTYSYIVTDINGCTSESPQYEIEIFQSPEDIIITCLDNLTPGNITFEWEEIAGLTYQVDIINPNNIQGTINNNQLIFENLPPLTEIEIAVTATGPGPDNCNSSTETFTCVTDDCDLSTPQRNNFVDIVLCQDNTSGSIQFDIETTPDIQGEYVGQAVNSAGLLDLDDPVFDIPGLYAVSYNYTDLAMTCIEQIGITIEILPEINIEPIIIDDICIGDSTELLPSISGSSNNYTYLWTPEGSTGNSLIIPEDLNTPAGTYEVTLTVSDVENICRSVQTYSYTIIESIEDVINLNTSITCNELPGDYPNFIDFSDIQNVQGIWYDENDIALTAPDNYIFDGFPASEYNFYFVPDNSIPCLEDRYDFTVIVEDCGCPDIVLDTPQSICSPLSGNDNYVLSASIPGTWSINNSNATIVNGNQLVVNGNTSSADYEISFNIDNPTLGCITDTTVIIRIEQITEIEFIQGISACHIDSGSGLSIIDLDDLLISNIPGTWSSTNNEFDIDSDNKVDFDGADIQPYTFLYEIEATDICPAVSYPIVVRVRDCSCPDFAISTLPPLCTNDPILDLNNFLVNPESLDGNWTVDGQPSDGMLNPALYDTDTYEIQYLIQDPAGGNCDSIASNTIDLYQALEYMLSPTEMTFCNSEDNMEHPFFVNLLDINNSTIGRWDAPLNYNNGVIADTTNISFNATPPGLYTFTFTPTQNANSPCNLISESFTAEVIDCSCPILSLQNNSVCSDAIGLYDLNDLIIESEGSGQWAFISGASQAEIIQEQFIDITDLDGDYNLSYALTDVNPGCNNSENAFLTVVQQYENININDITACNRISEAYDYTLDLTALVNYPGEWLPPANYTNTFIDASDVSFLDQELGTYAFTYLTEPNGVCEPISIALNIEVVQCCDDILYTIDTQATCPGEAAGGITLLIENSTPTIYTYSIDNGTTFSDDITFDNLSGGSYSIILRDEELCETIINDILVEEYNLLDVNLGSDIRTIASNTPYTLSINSAIDPNDVASIRWIQDSMTLCEGDYDECETIEIDIDQSTIICIEVIDDNGCLSSDCVSIDEVIPQRIYIPTTFSPTSIDNKYFYIGADEFIESVSEFKIYDRWGELIFDAIDYEVNKPEQGWDGTYNGELINQGVYVYFVKVRFKGEPQDDIYTGTITLVR